MICWRDIGAYKYLRQWNGCSRGCSIKPRRSFRGKDGEVADLEKKGVSWAELGKDEGF